MVKSAPFSVKEIYLGPIRRVKRPNAALPMSVLSGKCMKHSYRGSYIRMVNWYSASKSYCDLQYINIKTFVELCNLFPEFRSRFISDLSLDFSCNLWELHEDPREEYPVDFEESSGSTSLMKKLKRSNSKKNSLEVPESLRLGSILKNWNKVTTI